jgi:hypothetical protein
MSDERRSILIADAIRYREARHEDAYQRFHCGNRGCYDRVGSCIVVCREYDAAKARSGRVGQFRWAPGDLPGRRGIGAEHFFLLRRGAGLSRTVSTMINKKDVTVSKYNGPVAKSYSRIFHISQGPTLVAH